MKNLTPAQKSFLTKEIKAQMAYIKDISNAYKYGRQFLGRNITKIKVEIEINHLCRLHQQRYGRRIAIVPRVPEQVTEAKITLESSGSTGKFILTTCKGYQKATLWSGAQLEKWANFKTIVEETGVAKDSTYDFFIKEYNLRLE